MSEECLDECNERTTYFLDVSFKDEDGDSVVPDSATYRIDRPKLRLNVKESASIGSLAATVTIIISSDHNQIFRSNNPYELQEVTIEFDYTSVLGSAHGTAKYQYKILNLYGVVTLASPSISPSASASPST